VDYIHIYNFPGFKEFCADQKFYTFGEIIPTKEISVSPPDVESLQIVIYYIYPDLVTF